MFRKDKINWFAKHGIPGNTLRLYKSVKPFFIATWLKCELHRGSFYGHACVLLQFY